MNELTDGTVCAVDAATGAEIGPSRKSRFNTVFAQHMSTGQVNGEVLTAFVAGDSGAARNAVLELARAIGFDAVDSGPLKNARYLEPLAFLNIQLSWELFAVSCVRRSSTNL